MQTLKKNMVVPYKFFLFSIKDRCLKWLKGESKVRDEKLELVDSFLANIDKKIGHCGVLTQGGEC